jgi:N utilization substance protein B
MNRHLARTLAMQTLYEWDFQPNKPITDLLEDNIEASDHVGEDGQFAKDLVDGVVDHKTEIDTLVTKTAPEWPLDQISVIDKSILRLALFELLYVSDVPGKVAINEAVELAKTFGGDNSSRFINGVLGTIYRQSDRYKKESQEEVK